MDISKIQIYPWIYPKSVDISNKRYIFFSMDISKSWIYPWIHQRRIYQKKYGYISDISLSDISNLDIVNMDISIVDIVNMDISAMGITQHGYLRNGRIVLRSLQKINKLMHLGLFLNFYLYKKSTCM